LLAFHWPTSTRSRGWTWPMRYCSMERARWAAFAGDLSRCTH
jgi:hypothetical protein